MGAALAFNGSDDPLSRQWQTGSFLIASGTKLSQVIMSTRLQVQCDQGCVSKLWRGSDGAFHSYSVAANAAKVIPGVLAALK